MSRILKSLSGDRRLIAIASAKFRSCLGCAERPARTAQSRSVIVPQERAWLHAQRVIFGECSLRSFVSLRRGQRVSSRWLSPCNSALQSSCSVRIWQCPMICAQSNQRDRTSNHSTHCAQSTQPPNHVASPNRYSLKTELNGQTNKLKKNSLISYFPQPTRGRGLGPYRL